MEEIKKTLNERGSRYGDFRYHAEIAQNLQDIITKTSGWEAMTPYMRQGLLVITDKIARACNGDPFYDDNWRDIIGYATLILDRLEQDVQLNTEATNDIQATDGFGEPIVFMNYRYSDDDHYVKSEN